MPKLQRGELELIRPTQICVGFSEVGAKELEIAKIPHEKLDAWLREHPIPCVASPDGKLYLTDHHHLGLALWRCSERFGYEAKKKKSGENPFLRPWFTIARDFQNTELSCEQAPLKFG